MEFEQGVKYGPIRLAVSMAPIGDWLMPLSVVGNSFGTGRVAGLVMTKPSGDASLPGEASNVLVPINSGSHSWMRALAHHGRVC